MELHGFWICVGGLNTLGSLFTLPSAVRFLGATCYSLIVPVPESGNLDPCPSWVGMRGKHY